MTRLLLVRHGESEWNAAGRWQGQADPPLTDLGRRQARLAARAIGGVDAIVASDLQRAWETAELIAGELGVGPVLPEPLFRERSVGEWSGLTSAEIHERFPGYLPGPDDDIAREDRKWPPGWEHDDEVLARVLEGIQRAAAEAPGGDVLVLTHGGVVYTLEAHMGAPRQRLENLAGRWLELGDGKLRLGDRVVLVDYHQVAVTEPHQL